VYVDAPRGAHRLDLATLDGADPAEAKLDPKVSDGTLGRMVGFADGGVIELPMAAASGTR
jgi:hypothetical protein